LFQGPGGTTYVLALADEVGGEGSPNRRVATPPRAVGRALALLLPVLEGLLQSIFSDRDAKVPAVVWAVGIDDIGVTISGYKGGV